MKKEEIMYLIGPRVCHLAWVCYQMACGQNYNIEPDANDIASHDDAIRAFMNNPDMTPEENHNNWMIFRKSQGWIYGEVKDKEKKTHPDLVPFDKLPKVEQMKDTMDITARRTAWRLAKMLEDTE
jgi:hypothetical protein